MAGGIVDESNVAEVGVPDRMQVRYFAGGIQPHKRFVRIPLFIDLQQLDRLVDTLRPEIDRLQNAAFQRQQLRGEGEFALTQTRVLEHLGNMPVSNHRIGAEVVADFTKTGLQARLPASSAHSGLRVADNSPGPVDYLGIHKWTYGEISRRWIAARISHQTSPANLPSIELWQAVNGLRKQLRGGMGLWIPLRKSLHIPEAECAAEVNDPDSCFEEARCHVHRHLRGSSQEYRAETLRFRSLRRGRDCLGKPSAERMNTLFRFRAVLQKIRIYTRVAVEEPEQLCTTVSPETDHTNAVWF